MHRSLSYRMAEFAVDVKEKMEPIYPRLLHIAIAFALFLEAKHSYNRGVLLFKSHEHMQKEFKINRTKIQGDCQSGRKVVAHDSKSN